MQKQNCRSTENKFAELLLELLLGQTNTANNQWTEFKKWLIGLLVNKFIGVVTLKTQRTNLYFPIN